MTAATWPRDDALEERMLLIDPRGDSFDDARVGDLPRFLRGGDLLVLNDAATLPASLAGDGVELRLREQLPDGTWEVVLFGQGDWRTPTERRPPPPRLSPGDRVTLTAELGATVVDVSPLSPRLVRVRFEPGGDALWTSLYAAGRPVQYSYLARPLALWHVQTAYGARPWAVEMPSAGRALRWGLLLELKRRGVQLAAVTHAAGLSSTGDEAIDGALPLAERFDVPAATVSAIREVKEGSGRVVAVGTSVVRALEGNAALHDGVLTPGSGVTDLRIHETFVPRVVDGLFTGMHESTASHFALLQAFAPRSLIERAYAHARGRGYLWHEFGDSSLIAAA